MRKELLARIDVLYRCADKCDDATASYLGRDEKHRINGFAAVSLDCAELLRFTARMLTRESEISPALCAACANACERCAELAAAHEGRALEDCSAACRRCASECRSVAGLSFRADKPADSATDRVQ